MPWLALGFQYESCSVAEKIAAKCKEMKAGRSIDKCWKARHKNGCSDTDSNDSFLTKNLTIIKISKIFQASYGTRQYIFTTARCWSLSTAGQISAVKLSFYIYRKEAGTNGSEHSRNCICSLCILQRNFDLLLSFADIRTLLHCYIATFSVDVGRNI